MRLQGPAQIILAVRVRSEAEFRAKVLERVRALGVRHGDGVYIMRIEHGRCIADCPCGSGVAVHPAWREAGCFECGRWWPVLVPAEWRDIEAALVARPRLVNRGWVPGETIEKLEDENAAHGLPRRAAGAGARRAQER